MRAKIIILLEDIEEDKAYDLADELRGHSLVETKDQDNVILETSVPLDDKDFEHLRTLREEMGYTAFSTEDIEDCEHKAVIIKRYPNEGGLIVTCAYCGVGLINE